LNWSLSDRNLVN